MLSKALALAKKQLPACLVISTVVMVIHEVTDYEGFYPITWLITVALTAFTLYILYAIFILLSLLKKRWAILAAALLVLCVVIRTYWPPWSDSRSEQLAEGIVERHDILQRAIAIEDEVNITIEEVRRDMEDDYDRAAKHLLELPIAERRDFLKSIRANLDDDSNDDNIVITNFIAAMNERGVHIEP